MKVVQAAIRHSVDWVQPAPHVAPVLAPQPRTPALQDARRPESLLRTFG